VFLDALLGFLVMQIFIYQIHETFESIDVEQLNRLKH
jgi:hydrogenase-4 membrane subunit HyfE